MATSTPPRIKLTKRAVDALASTDKDQVIFDAELSGFGLKITPSGRKVFLVQYRYPPGRAGRIRRYTIGAYGESLTPDQARGIAVQVKGKLAAGIDPVSERDAVLADAAKAAQEKKRMHATSVDAVATAFIERHAKPRLRSWREYERMLRGYVLPEWGTRPITEIQRSDVTALLDAIEERRSAALADHVLAIIRKMFNWHAARDERFHSPLVSGMARTSITVRARDRVLSDHELRALWAALQQIPYPFGPFVQLLLLTAQRRDEVAHMRWSEIDGDLWTIPRERYKNGRANTVPLTEQVQSILASLPRSGDYVFTTTGRAPISGFSKAKAAIDRACGVTGWRLHDLRRTARSLMSRTGVSSEIAERVLGHAMTGVAGVYDRHGYVSEKRDALQKLAAQIGRIVA
ncbi:tyrosine-type recombinase/integrase [Microvirga arabica]|uniref:Tyrosine-type recombinase/integrase n=1 Tax=Microvirga arabica TaxID=1128671 RepID=A0ABV6Y9V7_9HYPH